MTQTMTQIQDTHTDEEHPMTTINDLAHIIADRYGLDPDVARTVVTVHVDQISDDPDLYDPDAETLTGAGTDLVTRAVAESYRVGAVSTSAGMLLEQIEATAAAITQATARRDELIRRAMRTELPRADIARAAGVTEGRLYQIRDGRR